MHADPARASPAASRFVLNRGIVAGGLCVLAAAVPGWWLALHASEPFRELFVSPTDWDRFRAFLYADAGLTLITAVAGIRALRGTLTAIVAGLAVGAWGYATLWAIGAWATRSLTTLGVLLMVGAFVLVSLACHALVSPGRANHR